VIDLDAITANIDRLRAASSGELMVVVKADAYGHGMLPVAAHARRVGVEWLGVALPEEALDLRAAGDTGRILAWLATPEQSSIDECVAQQVDLGVSTSWALEQIAAAAHACATPARIHLKIDTGLSRGGASAGEWSSLIATAAEHSARGTIIVDGVWSHLVSGEDPNAPITTMQAQAFTDAISAVMQAGLDPTWRHLANSGAVLSGVAREMGFEHTMVRCGIAAYGITPGVSLGESSELGLRPAMTLRARLAQVKDIPAGQGVSYGHHWIAQRDTTVGLVPVGYADGLPRTAVAPSVQIAGRRCAVIGRIAMDQCVVDVSGLSVTAGDDVIIFGPGDQGEPTAEDWARWSGTIGYEIVTRIGPRVPRDYVVRDSRIGGPTRSVS
jgi:alanine racemase